MLHAKFQDNGICGSREVFYIYGLGSHLGHVTSAIYTNVPPTSQGVSI